VNGYQMTLGSAGMPPALIYRAARRVVDEISLPGIPLGSLTAYSYRECRRLNRKSESKLSIALTVWLPSWI